MSATAVILDVDSLATAAGVAVGVWQIRLNRRQATTAFEDSLTQSYRSIAAELPIEVFLDEPVAADVLTRYRSPLYRYFDLSNEQVFLRSVGRVTRATWAQWRDGIRTNMSRDAFARAWTEHFDRQTGDDFDELRRLMLDYEADPASWS